eukprot:EG_transcript_9436
MADVREGNVVIRLVCLSAIIALILAAIAMALPFWSQQGNVRYGLWAICITGPWANYTVELCTPVPPQGSCQGLYDAARALSAVGIAFIGGTVCTSFGLVRHRKLKGWRLSCAVWALGLQATLAVVATVLCWVLWLALVQTSCGGRGKIQDFGAPWIVQIVASGVMLLSCLLACAGGYLIAVRPRTTWRKAQSELDAAVLGVSLNPGVLPDDDPWATQQPATQPQFALLPPDQASSHRPSYQPSAFPDHASASGRSTAPADLPPLPFQSSRFKSQYRSPTPNVPPQPPEPVGPAESLPTLPALLPPPGPGDYYGPPDPAGYGDPGGLGGYGGPPGPMGYGAPPDYAFQPQGTQYYTTAF